MICFLYAESKNIGYKSRTLSLDTLCYRFDWLTSSVNRFGANFLSFPFIGSKAPTAVRSTCQTAHVRKVYFLPSTTKTQSQSGNFEIDTDTPRCHILLPVVRLSLPASPAFPLVSWGRGTKDGGEESLTLPPPDHCHSAVAPAWSPPPSPKLSKVFAQKEQKERKEKFAEDRRRRLFGDV